MDSPAQPLPAPKWWLGLAAGLVLGLGGMLMFSMRDAVHRRDFETISEPSALGDLRYFTPPPALDKVTTLARWKGRALIAEDTEPMESRDSRMLKLGDDDTGAFAIYESRDPAEKGFLFLKLRPERYLKVR